jgi:hypothetical protein
LEALASQPELAASLHNLSVLLSDLDRPEDALAAGEEAVAIRRELAARWPDAYHLELEPSLGVIAWLEASGDLSDASPADLSSSDNGPLSRVPVAALLAALPDAIMYSHRYGCTWVVAAQGDSEGPTFISRSTASRRSAHIQPPSAFVTHTCRNSR